MIMNASTQYRLMKFLTRFHIVPGLRWIAGLLIKRIYRRLKADGWGPVDYRAGYKVPDYETMVWEAPMDPRMVSPEHAKLIREGAITAKHIAPPPGKFLSGNPSCRCVSDLLEGVDSDGRP